VAALLWLAPAQAQLSASAEETFNQGTQAMRAGSLDEAAGDFSKVIAADPSFAQAYFNLGLVRMLQQEPAAAIEPLSKAVALKPTLRGAHMFLGIAYHRTNDNGKATTELKKELHLDPSNATAMMWLGVAQLSDGDTVAACATLDQAAELKPNDVDILYHRGRAHMLVSKESYEQMFHADPNSWRVHEVLAQAYLEGDRYDDAIAEYQLAITARPEEPGLHEELGDAYQKRVQLPEAEAAFREELKISPDSTTAMYKLAVVSFEHSEPEAAAKLLSQVLTIEPHYADAEYQLGRADAQLGNLDGAIRNFSAAIADSRQKDTDTVRQTYYELAQVYRRAQRPTESRTALEAFLKLKQQADSDQAQKLQDKLNRSGQTQEGGRP
jgi:tetratricopeptide (TPR) repeat protein